MGLFGFFDHSWKKTFDELLTTNKDAVESYIKKEYKVYKDMRPDDKSIIEDYLKVYDSQFLPLTTYIEPIENISKEAKKFIVQRKNEVIRLYYAYSKYTSPQKRVLSLYTRFRKDGVFDKTFGEYLGEEYDINILDNEQITYILDNYHDLVILATEIREQRIQKQKDLKDRLRKKSQDRRISELIKRQQSLSAEISLANEHSELTSKLQTLVEKLSVDFESNGIFMRVMKSMYPSLESTSSLTDSQSINILAHKCEMEKEKEFFELIKRDSYDEKKYKAFLKAKNYKDDHEGVIYCHDHYVEFQLFIMSYEKVIQFQQWIHTQETINEKSKTLASHILPGFVCHTLKMYVETIDVNGETMKKVLPFNHFCHQEFTYEEGTTVDLRAKYAYVYYNRFKAQNAKRSVITHDSSIMDQISQFVFNMMTQMAVGGIIVVLGTSDADNIKGYNNNHFGSLREKLNRYSIECVNIADLNKDNVKTHIIVLEMVSEVDRFRPTCKSLSKNYPGSTIIYISIYSELTKAQLTSIKNGL